MTKINDNPALPAVRVDDGGIYRLFVFCPWCESVHGHGMSYGNRAPHCYSFRGSPFKTTGYDLVEGGDGYDADDALPAGVMVGQGKFRVAIEVSRLNLQVAFTKALLGLKRGGAVLSQHVPGGRVNVFPPAWNMRTTNNGCAEGRMLLGLVRTLFGVPEGVAAVRVIEGVTGANFDAQAARETTAAVDSWIARGAPSGEGRS